MRDKREYFLQEPTWCPGCGLYAVLEGLKKSAASLDIPPEQLVIVTGIGCHGRLNNYFRAYGFHGLHGRVLPVASGIKLSNHFLHVVGISGDGDAYSIGMSHFIHAVRRNITITYIVVNNRVFALTQGQASPASRKGFVSRSTPYGFVETPLNGPQVALAAGGTFVARGFSGDPSHLTSLLKRGMTHRGYAFIEVFSPCITQNREDTYNWFKENIYKLEDDPTFNSGSLKQAWERVSAEDKIPVGLIFREEKPAYEELVLPDREKALAFIDIRIRKRAFEKVLEEFR